MTEIESHLYAIDKNSRIFKNMANQTQSFDKNINCKSNNKSKKQYPTSACNMSNIIYYNCGEPGHIA